MVLVATKVIWSPTGHLVNGHLEAPSADHRRKLLRLGGGPRLGKSLLGGLAKIEGRLGEVLLL